MIRLGYALGSAVLALILSFVAMAASIGESCGFYPGMLVVAIFGPLLLGTVYGGSMAAAMVLIGAVGGKRGLYINAVIVLLGITAFAFLAIAAMHGYVPWPSRCTIDF